MPTSGELGLDDIELLAAIGATGSMAAAARELGKVPSALSYQVRRLEERLDLLLVDRRSGRAQLTESAQLLVREGRDVRSALDGALTRARRAALGFESELVIAALSVGAGSARDLCLLLVAFSEARAFRPGGRVTSL
jgi:molybdate transport repressor ModE-like protein